VNAVLDPIPEPVPVPAKLTDPHPRSPICSAGRSTSIGSGRVGTTADGTTAAASSGD
jgi:hypothetical protein